MRVKICGLVREKDVEAAVEAGADAVGFVLAASPRQVTLQAAMALCRLAAPPVMRVAVLRKPKIAAVVAAGAATGIDRVQCEVDGLGPMARLAASMREIIIPVLHDEPGLTSLSDELERQPPGNRTVLVEGPGRGGRGMPADWQRVAEVARRVNVILAGGLTPDNVGDAIRIVRPFAVDVSSGVEIRPGVKDPVLLREFILAVRQATVEAESVA